MRTKRGYHQSARVKHGTVRVVQTDRTSPGDRQIGNHQHELPEGAMVKVSCWCERKFVEIPADLVGVTTESCGRRGCKPPR